MPTRPRADRPGVASRAIPAGSGFGLGALVLLVGVPLLGPWVGVDVIAADLLEPPDVPVLELQAPEPFRALPRIPFRHDQPQRKAVFGLERRPAVPPRHEDVVIHHRLEGKLR